MIAFLKGQLLLKSAESIVLFAGEGASGVGYDVHLSQTTLSALPEVGEKIELHIHTHVAEGILALYGFKQISEKILFRRLMSVSGIGPKLAMQILSGYSPGVIIEAVLTADIAKLTSISGVGKKTAERMVMELKDKLSDLSVSIDVKSLGSKNKVFDEALSVLINLGYQRLQAERVLSTLTFDTNSPLEAVIKMALTSLSKAS